MNVIVQKARILLHFFVAQGITLAGSLLYGLLCVRLLPTSEYAKFVVVFSVCGTLVVLMDANFSTSLIPLVGERVDDRQLIADYVASLRQLSRYIYGIVAAGTIILFPLLVKNRGWSWEIVVAMIATLLFSTWFIRVSSSYGPVLVLIRERELWYRGQMIQSLGTLALLGIFWAFHLLNGFIAIFINVVGILFVGIYNYQVAKNRLGKKGTSSRQKREAIIRLALPNAPQAIFYAVQGQLSVFLITFFGHASGVASVGALARLASIFALLAQMNSILVEPYFAKLPNDRLKKAYMTAALLATAVCATISVIAWLLPEVFLWALGPQYHGLKRELLLVIASGGISTLSGVLWCIHSARRFLYWWNVGLSITIVVITQVICIVHFDMGTTRGVLMLNLYTNVASLVAVCSSGVYGLIYGPREVEDNAHPVPERVLEAESMMETETVHEGSLPASSPSHSFERE